MRPLPLLLLLTLSLSAALAVALPSPAFQSSPEEDRSKSPVNRRTQSLGQVDTSNVNQTPTSSGPSQPDSLDMYSGTISVESSRGSSDGNGKKGQKGGLFRNTVGRFFSGGENKPPSEKLSSIGWFGRTKNSEKPTKPTKISSKASEGRSTFGGRTTKDEIPVFQPPVLAPMPLNELDRIVSLLIVLMLDRTATEGLIRHSGSDVNARKLLNQLKRSAGNMQSKVFYDIENSRDALKEAGFDDLANTVPHDLSTTFKKAMAEYHKGYIIPYALWTALYEASQLPEEGQRLEAAVQALAHNPLDPHTSHILGMTLHLMNRIIAQKAQNKLDLEGLLVVVGKTVFDSEVGDEMQAAARMASKQSKNADEQKKLMDVNPAQDVGKLLFTLFNQRILSQITEIQTYPEGMNLPLIAEIPTNARLTMQPIPSDQLYSEKQAAQSIAELNKERSSSGESSPERKTEESEEDLPEKDETLSASTQLKLQMTKSI